jgi:hypothetical protein
MKKRNYKESFSKSYKAATHLYIAYSPKSHFFKIGITRDINQRITLLNSAKPDGSSDWKYLATVRLGKVISGTVETQLGCSLQKYNVHRNFEGKSGYCRELYSCPLDEILLFLNYRLLPEERKALELQVKRKLSASDWNNWLSRPFYKPKKTDNWNIKKGLYNPNKNADKKARDSQSFPKRTNLTPFAQMLQDKYNVRVTT